MGHYIVFFSTIITAVLFSLSKIQAPPQDYWHFLAQITGVFGIFLMSWTFLLSLRHQNLERLFSGLDRVYRLHHILGGLSYILLLNHPIFLILSRLPQNTLAVYLLPGESQSYNLGIYSFYLLNLLLIFTIFINLPYRLWKKTHEFIGLVILLGGLHSLQVVSDISRFAPLRYWIVFWIIAAFIAFVYKRFFYYFSKGCIYKITSSSQNGQTLFITLAPLLDSSSIRFRPGQYAFLSFPGSRDEHPFTILNHHTSSVSFAIKVLSGFTHQLASLSSGERLIVRGPFGTFFDPPNHHPQVWIAGGIGITPFVSALNLVSNNQEVVLYWSHQNHNPVQISNIFSSFSKTHPNFTFITIDTSREPRLTVDRLRSDHLVSPRHHYYLCGSLQMMEDLSSHLIKSGVRRKYINYEDFSFK